MSNQLTQENATGKKVLVLAFCLLAMIMCLGFNTTSLAILLPSWTEEMGFTTAQYGLLAGAVAMGTVWTAFIAGLLLDKFKPKNLMIIAILANGIIMFSRGFISDFTTAYVVLFLSGISAAVINPGCLKMANAWFDRRMTYKVNGMLISGGAIGYFIGFNGTLPWAQALGGWDRLFQVFGVLIVILGILFMIFIPHRDEAHGAMNVDLGVETEGYTLARKVKETLTSKQILLCLIAEFFIAGAILTFSSVGPLAFTTIWKGLSVADAGLIISMSNVGSTIGYWVLPPIADKFGYRKRFMMPAVIWSCTLYALSPFTGNVLLSCIMINLAGFGNGFGLISARTLMMEHPDCAGIKAGTASGFLIELNKIGCVIFPIIFTTLFESSGAMLAWIGMFILGACGVIFLGFAKETGRKAAEKEAAENVSDR